MKRTLFVVLLVVVALLLAGCGRDEASATPISTPSPTLSLAETPEPSPVPDCADEFELPVRDDDPTGAKVYRWEKEVRNFDQTGDVDWVKFTAHPTATHTIRTSHLGNGVDTELTLFSSESGGWGGQKELARNDDDETAVGTRASRIEFTPAVTGTYFVRIENRYREDSSSGGYGQKSSLGGCGAGYSYQFVITAEPIPPAPDLASDEGSEPGAEGASETEDEFQLWVQDLSDTQPTITHSACPISNTGGGSVSTQNSSRWIQSGEQFLARRSACPKYCRGSACWEILELGGDDEGLFVALCGSMDPVE